MGKKAESAKKLGILNKVAIVFSIVSMCAPPVAFGQDHGESQIPLLRGPGVSQEQLEAVAESLGRPTLSEQLDLLRPGQEMTTRLHKLVERAQTAWLSGSMETARATFKEITRMALEADWRPSQREAIHYAFLRLAQSAPTPTERDEWLEHAVVAFSDLAGDEDTFPPPLTDSFRATRARLLALAKFYAPFEHFPDHRYLLINGRRFAITPDLKIKLPNGKFRVTALSDAFAPMTEKLTSSQLDAFRLAMPAVAAGSCESPSGADGLAPNFWKGFPALLQYTVVYSLDCQRTRTTQGWQDKRGETSELSRLPDETIRGSSVLNEVSLDALKPIAGRASTVPERPTTSVVSGSTWLWIGVSALAVGVAYSMQKEASREQAPKIEPVHRTGF